ncbi:Ras-related and estrogen-regulated growth inhibitor [Eumeta japonica]|uniref:small monomeric GTPase n=1 Tax=Eumeta variegata TaxID=151549 RepID=A0A4C1Y0J9_EUMVA|nr:Ras-related and estrogen-regulated growth inhibitor [Eumeta japonica]
MLVEVLAIYYGVTAADEMRLESPTAPIDNREFAINTHRLFRARPAARKTHLLIKADLVAHMTWWRTRPTASGAWVAPKASSAIRIVFHAGQSFVASRCSDKSDEPFPLSACMRFRGCPLSYEEIHRRIQLERWLFAPLAAKAHAVPRIRHAAKPAPARSASDLRDLDNYRIFFYKTRGCLAEHLRWGDAFAVVYSVCERRSFVAAGEILALLERTRLPCAAVTLLANKTDLEPARAVTAAEGQQLSLRFGCQFYEVSAAESAAGAALAFHALLREARALALLLPAPRRKLAAYSVSKKICEWDLRSLYAGDNDDDDGDAGHRNNSGAQQQEREEETALPQHMSRRSGSFG